MLELNATEQWGNALIVENQGILLLIVQSQIRSYKEISRDYSQKKKGISQTPNQKTNNDRGKGSARRIDVMKPPKEN